MKNYLVIKSKEEMEQVRDRFKKYFEIDLDDKRYDAMNIKEAWELVVQDIFDESYKVDYVPILKEYIMKLDTLARGESLKDSDGIYRSSEHEDKWIRECSEELKKEIKKIMGAMNSYSILESDIWINAYLSYKLIMKIDDDEKKKEKTSWNRDKYDRTLYVVNYSYLGFCETFRKEIYMKKYSSGDIFEYDENSYKCEISSKAMLNKRVECILENEKRCKRWSRTIVEKQEKKLLGQLEDEIMFCKTINGVLARNIVDSFREKNEQEIGNYMYFISKLCFFDSLIVQNFLWCFGFYSNSGKVILDNMRLDKLVNVLMEAVLEDYLEVNKKMSELSRGLAYLMYKKNCNCEEAKKSALREQVQIHKNHIYGFKEKLLGERDLEIEKIDWDVDKVTKRIFMKRLDWKWIYVMVQKSIIYWQSRHYKAKHININWNLVFQTYRALVEKKPEYFYDDINKILENYSKFISKRPLKEKYSKMSLEDVREIVKESVDNKDDCHEIIKSLLNGYLEYRIYILKR